MTNVTTIPNKASPPRQPTPGERRRILDALEERYDIEAGRYRLSWSDESLATYLQLPRAWVRDLRQNFCGHGEGNEAQSEDARLLTSVERQMDEIKTLLARIETALTAHKGV